MHANAIQAHNKVRKRWPTTVPSVRPCRCGISTDVHSFRALQIQRHATRLTVNNKEEEHQNTIRRYTIIPYYTCTRRAATTLILLYNLESRHEEDYGSNVSITELFSVAAFAEIIRFRLPPINCSAVQTTRSRFCRFLVTCSSTEAA